METIQDIMEKYRHSKPIFKVNFLDIPVNVINKDDAGMCEFNKINMIVSSTEGMSIIERSPSQGISSRTIPPAYDIIATSTLIEITVLSKYGDARFQFTYSNKISKEGDYQKSLSGRTSFNRFKRELEKDGVDITSYQIANGYEIKKNIDFRLLAPKRVIAKCDTVYENANHLDLNSSYMSGLAFALPEFMPTIKRIYDDRNVHGWEKDVLTHTYGFMQSKYCNYNYSHLSKLMLEYNKSCLDKYSEDLVKTGHKILAYNCDGIWYQGDIYHNNSEGKELGQWKNDHVNCKIRFKSDGVYEFIEDEKYYPVMSGISSYETVVPRILWTWGDIYQGEVLKYHYDKDTFLICKI